MSNRLLPITALSVPVSDGGPNPGTRHGPAVLLRRGLAQSLGQRPWVGDSIDMPAPQLERAEGYGSARHAHTIAARTRALADRACRLAASGTIPVFLGGDHSLSIGSIGGIARHYASIGRELFVLWIDAHADFNTRSTTPSGNLHGMALAILTGEEDVDGLFGSGVDLLDRQNLLLLGTRSIDPGEDALLRRRNIAVADMTQIGDVGIRLPLQKFLDRVRLSNGWLHVSFDVDAIDPEIAPGVSTPVRHGLDKGQACCVFEMLRASGLARSLDIVEFDPSRDVDDRTADLVVRLVARLFGPDRDRASTCPAGEPS